MDLKGPGKFWSSAIGKHAFKPSSPLLSFLIPNIGESFKTLRTRTPKDTEFST
jgi:hypothetical protein